VLLRRRQHHRRKPRQRRASFTFDAIIEAAQQILASGDPEQFHMTVLARRAGVSSGTLYQYFPDWPAVLSGVVEVAWGRAAHEFRLRLEALDPSDLPNLLKAISALTAEITLRDQDLRTAVRHERQRHQNSSRQIDESEEWVRFFANVLRPHFPPDEEKLLAMARSMVWAADGIVEGASGRPETSHRQLEASLLAVWKGVISG
jgi:AcrR family transcriptional regulator